MIRDGRGDRNGFVFDEFHRIDAVHRDVRWIFGFENEHSETGIHRLQYFLFDSVFQFWNDIYRIFRSDDIFRVGGVFEECIWMSEYEVYE